MWVHPLPGGHTHLEELGHLLMALCPVGPDGARPHLPAALRRGARGRWRRRSILGILGILGQLKQGNIGQPGGKLTMSCNSRSIYTVLSHMSSYVHFSKYMLFPLSKVFRMRPKEAHGASVCQAARTGAAVLGAAVSASFRTPARPKGP